MLSLILGNLHVPYRAVDLPDQFKQLLKINQGKIEKIFICSTTDDPIMQATTSTSLLLEFLHKEVCSNIELVNSSNSQAIPSNFKHQLQEPLNLNHKTNPSKANCISVYFINSFKVAFISQFTIVPKDDVLALLKLSRQATSDILVWSGKHEVEAYSLEGVLFLSPGTATGAFSIEDEEGEEEELEENVSGNEDSKPVAIIGEEQSEEKEAVTDHVDDTIEKLDDINLSKDDTQIDSEEVVDEKLNPESKEIEETKEDNKNKDDNEITDNIEKKEDDEKLEKSSDTKNLKIDNIVDIVKSIENIPAFILLDIPETEIEGEDNVCTVYIYSLLGENKELKIDKVTFVKN